MLTSWPIDAIINYLKSASVMTPNMTEAVEFCEKMFANNSKILWLNVKDKIEPYELAEFIINNRKKQNEIQSSCQF